MKNKSKFQRKILSLLSLKSSCLCLHCQCEPGSYGLSFKENLHLFPLPKKPASCDTIYQYDFDKRMANDLHVIECAFLLLKVNFTGVTILPKIHLSKGLQSPWMVSRVCMNYNYNNNVSLLLESDRWEHLIPNTIDLLIKVQTNYQYNKFLLISDRILY